MKRPVVLAMIACTVSFGLYAETAQTFAVSQKGRAFSVAEIALHVGDAIRFTNEDGFLHQIFVHAPGFTVDSDEQRPGENVDVRFTVPGTFHVLCAIHPKMALTVDVQ